MRRLFYRRQVILLVLALLTLPALLQAQQPVLQGHVTDPDGAPVGGITVSLHRVTESGGAEVARAVSDMDGRFEIPLEPELAEGVYFVATRFEGVLYMGNPFRTLAEMPEDYRLVIGVGGITGGPAPQPAERPAEPKGTGVAILFIALGAAAVIYPIWRHRRGPHAVRSVLAAIAELDESHAALPPAERAAAEPRYREAREALHKRARALAGVDADAAGDD